jgi:RNA polymerase sigma-70 factor (ECF subfamily)
MDDTGLIAAMATGDDAALRELFARHAPWLAARLRSVLSAADVEDVLQETFLAAWQGAGRYRPDGPAGAWLWGIARRQAALFLRRRGPAALILPAVIPADGRNASDPAEAALSRAAIAEAVAALGPDGSPEREAWRLMYVEDRPVAEVAQLMGVPVGTVKSRAHRARRLLRAALRAGEPALRGDGPALRGDEPAPCRGPAAEGGA